MADSLPDLRYLIHSDLLHFNVLVEGERITGVLDWGCAMTGDFLIRPGLALLLAALASGLAAHPLRVVQEARRHYIAIGLAVPGFDQRLRCCQLHIGLAGMAYQAYAGDWINLEATERRTFEFAW